MKKVILNGLTAIAVSSTLLAENIDLGDSVVQKHTRYSSATVKLLRPTYADVISSKAIVKVQVSDPHETLLPHVKVDGNIQNGVYLKSEGNGVYSGVLDTTNFLNGNINISAAAFDSLGNQIVTESSTRVTIDNSWMNGGEENFITTSPNPYKIETLRGKAKISMKYTSDDISSIYFKVDGETYGTSYSNTVDIILDTRALKNGLHSGYFEALTTSGRVLKSSSTEFYVDNIAEGDVNLRLAFPSDGSVLSENFYFRANLSSEQMIKKLEVLLDGKVVASEEPNRLTAVFEKEITVMQFDSGVYNISVRATTDLGEEFESDPVSIELKNKATSNVKKQIAIKHGWVLEGSQGIPIPVSNLLSNLAVKAIYTLEDGEYRGYNNSMANSHEIIDADKGMWLNAYSDAIVEVEADSVPPSFSNGTKIDSGWSIATFNDDGGVDANAILDSCPQINALYTFSDNRWSYLAREDSAYQGTLRNITNDMGVMVSSDASFVCKVR